MAVAGGGHLPSKPPPVTAKLRPSTTTRNPPPVLISTNPSHVSTDHLQNLFSLCSHSVHRFPTTSDKLTTTVDPKRLRLALSHSHVVVSVFAHPDLVSHYYNYNNCYYCSGRKRGDGNGMKWNDWLGRWRVTSASGGELVGFGRAVSDHSLTASIHDVMVLPTLQRLGIGQMIVQRILRVLTSRGIYDISALCSEEERLFFKACGFGNDILESTTMMYTRSSSHGEENQVVHQVGRKQLLVPPDKNPFKNRV